ncbi:hypothetical protein F1880_008484, partial [Penicillium rolfsii]
RANKQLTRFRSQKGTLAICLISRRVVSLGISPGYVKNWIAVDRFREVYQSWKDAIIERFDFERQSFSLLLEGHSDYLSIIASPPRTPTTFLYRSVGPGLRAASPIYTPHFSVVIRRLRYLPHSVNLKLSPRGILVGGEENETEVFPTLGTAGPDYHVVLRKGNCASVEAALLHEKAGQ